MLDQQEDTTIRTRFLKQGYFLILQRTKARLTIGLLLNLLMLVQCFSQELSQLTFDTPEWQPGQILGGVNWQTNGLSSSLTAEGKGAGGTGKAARIPADDSGETRLSRMLTLDPKEKIAFVDFQIRPAADAPGSLGTLHINGAQIAFQQAEEDGFGEIWTFNGNDKDPTGTAGQGQWIKTSMRFPIAGSKAIDFLRLTIRHDALEGVWDAYVNERPIAMNLGFSGRKDVFGMIDFFGASVAETLLDNVAATYSNMLFADRDKDGMPDEFELANGGDIHRNDRNAIKPGTSSNFLDWYLASLQTQPQQAKASAPINMSSAAASSVDDLTIQDEAPHQAVGALKGALSVGSDGSSSYSIPLDLPTGTGGMVPQLSLAYSSGAGNGIVGLGWSLGGLQQITRGSPSAAKDGIYKPINFGNSDRFFLNGQRLVMIKRASDRSSAEYRTEIDSGARITSYGTDPQWWQVETKSGLVMEFGKTDDSRLSVAKGTLAWAVNQVSDTHSNYYLVQYARDSLANVEFANHRVTSIRYTGNSNAGTSPYCTVSFHYETRPDVQRSYSRFAAYRSDKRLLKIKVSSGSFVNHSYRLAYRASYQSGRSLLASVTKHAGDMDGKAVPPTTFNYDGLDEPENPNENPLWDPPVTSDLPPYGENLDASGQVNSMVLVDSSMTSIQLKGDVARAYKLASGGYNVTPSTRIKFDVYSNRLIKGAFIGLDNDLVYQSNTPLYRIGGDGTANLGAAFTGSVLRFTPGATQTFNLNIGAFGTGTKGRLVLILVDEKSEDGEDAVRFSNIQLFESGVDPDSVAPIKFKVDMELPQLFDESGRDMGIKPIDLNSDGLIDMANWRAIAFDTSKGGTLAPDIVGAVFLNTGLEKGSGFKMNGPVRPLGIPLSTQRSFPTPYEISMANDVLARPMDIDGDGFLDLLTPGNSKIDADGKYSNILEFHTRHGADWEVKAGWTLPFRIVSTSGPRARRFDYFEFTDLNADGWPDLILRTSSAGALVNRGTNEPIAGPKTSLAFVNNGRNGPGWTLNRNLALPAPLLLNNKDTGRRLSDLNGDGYPELLLSRFQGGTTVQEIHRLKAPGYSSWDPAVETGTPSDPYLPIFRFKLSNDNPTSAMMVDLNADGLPDLIDSFWDHGTFVSRSHMGTAERDDSPWHAEPSPSPRSYRVPCPLAYKSGESNETRFHASGHEMTDLNGDGLMDILYSDHKNPVNPDQTNLTFMNNGSGWQPRANWGLPGKERIFLSDSERVDGKRRIRLMDVNGDGFPDLLTSILGQTPKVWINRCRPEVLTSVTDGFGSNLSVGYRRMNDPTLITEFGRFHKNADGDPLPKRVYEGASGPLPHGHTAVINARPLVYFLGEPDGKGGVRKRFYRYGDMRFDRFNEASLGFGFTEVLDNLNGQLSKTENSRFHPFAGSPVNIRSWVQVNPEDVVPALSELVDTGKSYKRLLSEQRFRYRPIDHQSGSYRTLVTEWSQSIHRDLSGTILSSEETVNSGFDHLGFPTRVQVTKLDGSTVTTTSAYHHIATASSWFPGRLSQSTVVKAAPGKTTVSRTSSFAYSSTTGLLTRETIEPGNANQIQTSHTHDAFGNVTSTLVSTPNGGSRTTTTTYNANGRFAVKTTNHLGHSVRTGYDSAAALVSWTKDINGLQTNHVYDAFGTHIRSIYPDGTKSGESTGYASNASLPSAVASQVVNCYGPS
jgi:hypothetical protein